jgi:hypothetical protein
MLAVQRETEKSGKVRGKNYSIQDIEEQEEADSF